MVHFNELYITDDRKKIVIDAEIDNLPIYDNCYIDKITVTLKDDCDSSDKQEVVYENNDESGRQRRVHLCLPSLDHYLDFVTGDLSKHLFLVTVEAGVDSTDINFTECDCGWDNRVTNGFIYDTKKLYDNAVNMARSYGDTCDTNDASQFMDFILRYYAFIFAIKCGDID